MLTDSRVYTGIRQNQPLHGPILDQMRLDNLCHICLTYMAIPDVLWIYHEGWPMLALIQTASLIDSNRGL